MEKLWQQSQSCYGQTDHQCLAALLVQPSIEDNPSLTAIVRHHLGVLLHAFRRKFVPQKTYLHHEVALEELVLDVFFETARIVEAVSVHERVGYALLVKCLRI